MNITKFLFCLQQTQTLSENRCTENCFYNNFNVAIILLIPTFKSLFGAFGFVILTVQAAFVLQIRIKFLLCRIEKHGCDGRICKHMRQSIEHPHLTHLAFGKRTELSRHDREHHAV